MTEEIAVLGVGEAGKNIAGSFRQYPQYNVITVDSEGDCDHRIIREDSVEGYEKDYSDHNLYDNIEQDEIIFIFSGSGNISGAVGPLLEPVKDKNIYIHYVEPDIDLLATRAKMKERVVRNALMQMTRSAVFERMFFYSNPKIEEVLGGIPVKKYYERINEIISYTIHKHNCCKRGEPILGDIREPEEICRISTMGIIVEDEEEYFYDLKLPKEKEFYFSFTEEELENDENLVSNLRNMMKEKRKGELDITISYGIYESSFEEDYHLCVENTHVDQSLEFEEEEL